MARKPHTAPSGGLMFDPLGFCLVAEGDPRSTTRVAAEFLRACACGGGIAVHKPRLETGTAIP